MQVCEIMKMPSNELFNAMITPLVLICAVTYLALALIAAFAVPAG